jgi:predicted metal-dependent phosphoesterase TrpH
LAGDLHCHTKLSDGSLGIDDLISIAKRKGLSALAVTDHDTMAGANRAVIIGKRQGVQVIHGVEISTMDTARGRTAHLLCYLCDAPDRLEGLCHRIGQSRHAAAMETVRKVMRYFPITPELVVKCATGSSNIYPQHIMHALLDTGYADSMYGDVYKKLFGPEGAARVSFDLPDTREVLTAIHEAGGIAVLAHTHVHQSEDLLQELIPLSLDGVEVWHPYHTEEQSVALLDLAQTHELLVTGGTDFHGMYSLSARPIGSVPMPDDAVTALLRYKQKQKKG